MDTKMSYNEERIVNATAVYHYAEKKFFDAKGDLYNVIYDEMRANIRRYHESSDFCDKLLNAIDSLSFNNLIIMGPRILDIRRFHVIDDYVLSLADLPNPQLQLYDNRIKSWIYPLVIALCNGTDLASGETIETIEMIAIDDKNRRRIVSLEDLNLDHLGTLMLDIFEMIDKKS